MTQAKIPKAQLSEVSEAVRRFAALPQKKQEMALLILRGVQIGEDIAKMAPDKAASA